MRASAVATCIAVVDLPDPPFSLPTTMICATSLPFLTARARGKDPARDYRRKGLSKESAQGKRICPPPGGTAK